MTDNELLVLLVFGYSITGIKDKRIKFAPLSTQKLTPDRQSILVWFSSSLLDQVTKNALLYPESPVKKLNWTFLHLSPNVNFLTLQIY